MTDTGRTAIPIAPERRAWLTYQAMDQSDDIVLVLEKGRANESAAVCVAGTNDAFHRASGYTEEQIIGQSITKYFPNRAQGETLLDTVRHNGSLRTEMAFLRADGSVVVLGLHLMPVPVPKNSAALPCFIILGRDISAVLEARNVQLGVQKLLAKVFACIDEAVVIVDSGNRIVMTNPYTDQLLGHKPNALVGHGSLDIVAPRDRDLVAANRGRQMERGGDMTYEALLLRADGSEQTMRVRSVVVERDDGRHFRIVTLRPIAAPSMHTESAGHIKLVGLHAVREAMGSRWPTVADRAMATAETVIKRRCGPQDNYSRVDDISFLICFGALEAEEASFRAAIIGREIHERLIGQCDDPDTAQVRSIAATVSIPLHECEPIAVRHAALVAGLDRQMHQIEDDARQTLKAAQLEASCEMEPIRGRAGGEIVASVVCLPNALERKLICAFGVLPADEMVDFDLDSLLLGLAAKQAVTVLARGASHALLVPVGFDLFNNRPATERYLNLCRRLDRRVTKQLTFLISDLPEGLTRSRLFECGNRLRPFCAAVGYQAEDAAFLAPLDLAPSGNAVVALPASAATVMSAEKLKTLVGFLHARRMKLLIRRLESAEHAAGVLARGADLVSMARDAA